MTVSLVTGASSGIGRSLARRLALKGETIAALARRKPLLDDLVREITDAGGRALAIECDVTDRDQVRAAVAEAEAKLGPIDRLVACAGGGERTHVDAFDADHFDRIFALNVGGTVHCIEAVLPAMLARGRGHIVTVGSLAASRGLPEAAAYSAAKAAVANLTESLRIDLRRRGVSVTLLAPGFVRSKPSPNKRRKPFQVELEAAVDLMVSAILTDKKYYSFPRLLVLAAGVARMLPATLYDGLLGAAGRLSKRKT